MKQYLKRCYVGIVALGFILGLMTLLLDLLSWLCPGRLGHGSNWPAPLFILSRGVSFLFAVIALAQPAIRRLD